MSTGDSHASRSSLGAFLAARDFLREHRSDQQLAVRGFGWPVLDRFNWALDWFDGELAQGAAADQPALIITGEGAPRLRR